MVSRFVIGDIHGNIKALQQCIERSGINPQKDELVSLGDICDGFYNTQECVELLIQFKNLTWCIGNHDIWFINYIKNTLEFHEYEWWLEQGGQNTLNNYGHRDDIPKHHKEFWLKTPIAYHQNNDGMLFIHAGFDPYKSLVKQTLHTLTWDREVFRQVCNNRELHQTYKKWANQYKHIYIGHTQTHNHKPITLENITALDTGAGWNGKLTIMNIDTGEYWQSDKNIKSPR